MQLIHIIHTGITVVSVITAVYFCHGRDLWDTVPIR